MVKFILPPRADWYAYTADKVPALKPAVGWQYQANGYHDRKQRSASMPSHREVEEAKALGATALATDAALYAKGQGLSTADSEFLKTILHGGTLTDRISALTLLVQQSPLHNLRAFEQLIAMAKKSNRREELLAIDAVKDLLTGGGLSASSASGLLPSDRKLHYFIDQYTALAASSREDESILALLHFEETVKKLYFELIAVLEALSHDPLPHIRLKVTNTVFELLATKPEQESNLLKLLVNKLGDLDRKVSSRASFLINQLVTEHHPAMKLVVVKAVEEFMGRANVGPRALYYGAITLNQFALALSEREIAIYLVDLYFSIFSKLSGSGNSSAKAGQPNGEGKKKQAKDAKSLETATAIDTKIMSALLTGVNRAYPFASLMSRSGEPNAVSAVGDGDQRIDEVMDKHMGALFKAAHIGTFGITVQALLLIHQVAQHKENIADRFYRALYATLLDPRLSASSKHHTLYLNLLFKALHADQRTKRVQAFIKRIVQMLLAERNVGFVVGCLWMLSEVIRQRSGVWNMVRMPEDHDNSIEQFSDAPDNHGDQRAPSDDDGEDKDDVSRLPQSKKSRDAQHYDPFHRSPEYARAEAACLWELLPLVHHYHPTVQVYVQSLLQSQAIPIPDGVDPLETFTTARFLEKFVYKNPKHEEKPKHQSKMAGALAKGKGGIISVANDAKADAMVTEMLIGSRVPVNSSAFLSKRAEEVPIEERFFYQYFKTRAEVKPSKPEKTLHDDFDIVEDGDEGGDFSESEIERAIMASGGQAGMDDNDGDEDEMPDFDLDSDENGDSEGEYDMVDDTAAVDGDTADTGGFGDDDDDFDEDEFAAAFAEEDTGENDGDEDEAMNGMLMGDKEDEDGGSDDGYDSNEDRSSVRKKRKGGDAKDKLGFSLSQSPFASAEEFSRMIESNEGLDGEIDDDDLDAFGLEPISAADATFKKKGKKGGNAHKPSSSSSSKAGGGRGSSSGKRKNGGGGANNSNKNKKRRR
ncbi:RNA-binding ribosome biosynthesis protein mak21 [Sorochytrium milnesiophthora]